MSLDNPNEWKVNLTEERRQRDNGEKLEETDRDLIQLKRTLSEYFSKINTFLQKQIDKNGKQNGGRLDFDIGKISGRLLRQWRELPETYNVANLKKKINNEVFPELLEDGVPLLKQAYIDKFDETITRLQKRLENNTNPDILASLGRDIDMMTDTKQVISNFDFENLSSYIYGIETFDMLDNKRLLDERKSRLEVVLVKLEEYKDEVKSNIDLPREYKIEVVRQYLSIIKSYENALETLSA